MNRIIKYSLKFRIRFLLAVMLVFMLSQTCSCCQFKPLQTLIFPEDPLIDQYTNIKELRTSGNYLVARVIMGRPAIVRLYIWDWRDLKSPPRMYEYERFIHSSAIMDPNLIVVSFGPEISVRDLHTNKERRRFDLTNDWYCPVLSNSRDGRYVALYISGNKLKYFELNKVAVITNNTKELEFIPIAGMRARYYIAVSDNSQYAVSDNQIINMLNGTCLRPQPERGIFQVAYACFSPDSSRVYTLDSSEEEVNCWEVKTGKLLFQWRLGGLFDFDLPYGFRVSGLALSPDGNYLLATTVGPGKGTLSIWDTRTQKRILHQSTPYCWKPTFAPDSKRIAMMNADKNISIFEFVPRIDLKN